MVEKQRTGNEIISECIARWVKNCSDRILTDPMLSMLMKGLNYAETRKHLPVAGIDTVTKSACRSPTAGDVQELQAKVDKVLVVIKERLVNDTILKNRTPLSADDITKLLELCLRCTYFLSEYYGAAMGSPVPENCTCMWRNLRDLRWKLLWTHHAGGNVDATYTVLLRPHAQESTDHLNSI